MEERGHSEGDDDQSEDEREVDRLAEVDQIGGRPGEADLVRVVPAQAGQRRRAPRPGCAANDDHATLRHERLDEAGASSGTARAGASEKALQGEHRARPQSLAVEVGREHRRTHDPEGPDLGRLTAGRRSGQRNAHGRADPGAHVAHRLRAEHDLVGGRRKSTVDRCDEERAPEALPGHGVDHVAVDGHRLTDAGHDGHDAGSFDGSDQLFVLSERPGAVGRDPCIEVLAVQRGRVRQVGQARPEHGSAAEDRHRQDRTDEGRADRHGRAAAAPLQGVADPDERGGWCPGRGQHSDDPRRPHDRVVPAPRDQARSADRGPDAQREHGGDRDRRATEVEQGVEVEPRRRVGEPRLADGEEPGEPTRRSVCPPRRRPGRRPAYGPW